MRKLLCKLGFHDYTWGLIEKEAWVDICMGHPYWRDYILCTCTKCGFKKKKYIN